MRRPLAPALLLVAGLALAGCRVTSQDDETTAPSPSASPSSSSPVQPLPTTLPVGHGDVGPDDVVWAQASTLHVGERQWDLAPLTIDSFVSVPGGVFFLSGGTLWLTDLVKVGGTGVTGATSVATTADSSAVLVTTGRPPAVHAWSAITGKPLRPGQARPATPEDRLGIPGEIALQLEGNKVNESPQPAPARRGPGLYGILGVAGEPLVAFHAPSASQVPLRGVPGDGFELVRWTSGTTFYGLALEKGRPSAVVGCDLTAGTCTTRGRVVPGQPLVFESGT